MDNYLQELKYKHGYGWDERKWKLGTLDQIINSKKDDLRVLINEPVEGLDESKPLSAKDFKSIRGFFVDVDPIKSYQHQLMKQGADWTQWKGLLKKQINVINDAFLRLFKKAPSYITSSGKGIHVVFLFSKPIIRGRFSVEMEKKVGFIFKFIEMQLGDKFEVDTALFDIKTRGELFDRLILKKARPPIIGMKIKKETYDKRTQETTVKYATEICHSINNKVSWQIGEMAHKSFKGLMSSIFKYQREGYTAERKTAIKELSSRFSSNQDTVETDKKVYKIKCVIPSHEDNTPSAVFFKASGVYYCSGCEKALPLEDIYELVTGERLEVADRVTFFRDLPTSLVRYAIVGEDGLQDRDMLFTFLLAGEEEVTLALSSWATEKLQKWCAYNLIKGFSVKAIQPILEGIIERCDAKAVPRVDVVKAGFYTDKIVFENGVSYRKTEAGYMKSVNYDAVIPVRVNWGDADASDAIYKSMMDISDAKYNATVFAIIIKSMLSPYFVEQLSFHPFTYVYGNRDKGKTAIISLAQSIISTDYAQHFFGSANTEHVFISSLINYNHLPILIDEVKNLVERDSLIQTLKAMATNGGMIRKGKTGKQLFDTYIANADLFIASEFRVELDPSFYQRSIEINMNNYKINSKNAIKFNKLLRRNKTSVMFDLMEFMGQFSINFFALEERVEKEFDVFHSLEAKKRMGALLWVGALQTAYHFMEKQGMCKYSDAKKHIQSYLVNESKHNSKISRDINISDNLSIFLLSKTSKFSLPLLASKIGIFVTESTAPIESRTITISMSSKLFMSLGWRNPHDIGELKVTSYVTRALNKKSFRADMRYYIKCMGDIRLDGILGMVDSMIENASINSSLISNLTKVYYVLLEQQKEGQDASKPKPVSDTSIEM